LNKDTTKTLTPLSAVSVVQNLHELTKWLGLLVKKERPKSLMGNISMKQLYLDRRGTIVQKKEHVNILAFRKYII
jgi:hypothetical protein